MSLVRSRQMRTEEPEREDKSLMCRAHGCPMRWSVSLNMACSYHAWVDAKEWPRITDELNRVGPWKLVRTVGDTPTVRDMKTRLKGRLTPTMPKEYA